MGIDEREPELDDLHGWSPGPPDAARATVRGALSWGMGRATRSPGLVVLLWSLNLAVAAALVAPLYAAIHDHTATSTAAAELSRGFTAVWWTDFSNSRAQVLADLGGSLWAVGGLWLLLQVVLAGGVLTHLHSDLRYPFFSRFGRACGAYLGRFARLFVISLLWYGAVLWLDGEARILVEAVSDAGAHQAAAWWGHLLRSLLTVVLFFSVTLVFDYAKVRTVVTDSRSMILEAARSSGFVLRHPLRTGLLYVAMAGAGGVLILAYLAAAAGLERLGVGILGLFLLQQLYVAARIWLRLATWAGAISLYRGIASERLARATIPAVAKPGSGEAAD